MNADYTIDNFRVGQRIQLHPATDLWMRGARYGNVTKLGKELVTVQMDALRRPIKVAPRNLLPVE